MSIAILIASGILFLGLSMKRTIKFAKRRRHRKSSGLDRMNGVKTFSKRRTHDGSKKCKQNLRNSTGIAWRSRTRCSSCWSGCVSTMEAEVTEAVGAEKMNERQSEQIRWRLSVAAMDTRMGTMYLMGAEVRSGGLSVFE
jgi:hypothetical protein